MLRLISAVLHRQRGGLVSGDALDLRPAELGVIGPLVVSLLVLSAWPAAISGHSFPTAAPSPVPAAAQAARVRCTEIPTQPRTNKCMTLPTARSSVQGVMTP